METMKEWKNVLSDTGVSMDKQWMIAKIYEVIEPNVFEVSRPVQLVMIGDVLDWLWQKDIPIRISKWWITEIGVSILKLCNWREEKRKSIDNQSDECIKYVYDLVSEK